MHIVEKSSEIRLFLVGQSGALFEGTDGGLAYPSLPLYAFLRVGEITTPLGHEYALGLQRSSWLQPIYIVRMSHLWIEYEDAVREACSNDTKIKELRGLLLSRTYFERCLETGVDGEQQRIAALIPLDDLKEPPITKLKNTRKGYSPQKPAALCGFCFAHYEMKETRNKYYAIMYARTEDR